MHVASRFSANNGRRQALGGLSDTASAVNFHAHAGDHAGLVAAQEAGGVAQILGLREAADRDAEIGRAHV